MLANDYGSISRNEPVERRTRLPKLVIAVASLAVLVVATCLIVAVQDPAPVSLMGGWTDILADESPAADAAADPCACPKCVPQVVVMDTGSDRVPNPLNPFNPLFDARNRRHLLQASSGAASSAAASSGSAAAESTSGGSAAAGSSAAGSSAASSSAAAELGPDGRPTTCAPCPPCNPVVYDGDVTGDIPPNPLNPLNPFLEARAVPVAIERARPVVYVEEN